VKSKQSIWGTWQEKNSQFFSKWCPNLWRVVQYIWLANLFDKRSIRWGILSLLVNNNIWRCRRIPKCTFWIFFPAKTEKKNWHSERGVGIYYAQNDNDKYVFIAICPINGFITFLRGLWVRKWGNIKRFLLCTHARDPFRHDKRLLLGGLKYFASISEVDFRGFKTLICLGR